MKINAEQIAALRKSKLWSQQQLADAAGLSLRTVQRMEATGNASVESVKCIAAVFEVDATTLETEQRKSLTFSKRIILVASAALTLFVSAFFAHSAFAQNIMLHISVSHASQPEKTFSVLGKEGDSMQVDLDQNFVLTLTAKGLPNQQIALSAEIAKREAGQLLNLASPNFVTNNKQTATVTLDEHHFELRITPEF